MSEVSYSNVPPMMAAIKSGDIEVIRSLLHAGHSPNEPQCYQVMIGDWPRDDEASPLELAVLENRMDMAVDVLDIGTVHFPTGQIFACDPLVELEDTLPFLQTIPAGTYPVKICVVPSEQYGDRYACVKVEVSQEKPVRYELGMVGNEDLDEELGEDEYFGFGVDAGMGCVADIQTQAAFKAYWAKRLEEDPDIDPYNDLFCDLLEENAKAYPKYQGDCGDWLNWTVPGTDCNLPIFASGWGDGYYPVYFGYDAKGKICAVYVRFIDIEASYREQD